MCTHYACTANKADRTIVTTSYIAKTFKLLQLSTKMSSVNEVHGENLQDHPPIKDSDYANIGWGVKLYSLTHCGRDALSVIKSK